jgi:hypothetical protein
LKKINAYFAFASRGLWDMTLLHETIKSLPIEYEEINGGELPIDKGTVIFLPGDWASHIKREELNELVDRIRQLPFALILHTSDECRVFDSSFLRSNKIKTWVQNNYKPKQIESDRNVLFSYTPETLEYAEKFKDIERDKLWSFSGQITHSKRQEFAVEVRKREDGYLVETDGFAKGLSREDYFKLLSQTRIVPCPSGPTSIENFRMIESLECGCLPIMDNSAPNWNPDYNYWEDVLGYAPPFLTVRHWSQLHNILEMYKNNPIMFQEDKANCLNWWKDYKSNLVKNMMKDLEELSNV